MKTLNTITVEVKVRRDIRKVRKSIPQDELKSIQRTIDEDVQIRAMSAEDPKKAILLAWKQTENIIRKKLLELYATDSPDAIRLKDNRVENELSLTGVLSPQEAHVFWRLSIIKDEMKHASGGAIFEKTAIEYIEACKYIQRKVQSLTELPKASLIYLTYTILQITAMLDSGEYADITIEKAQQEIVRGTVLDFVADRGDNADFKVLTGSDNGRFREFYNQQLLGLLRAHEGDERKWGIHNSGLALLVAWTTEIIQQGGGWYPSTD